MVARLDARHARPDVDDDACALVAHDGREKALGIGARDCELVGMTDAGRLDLDQHLALLWTFEIDLDDLERLGFLEGYGGAGFHAAELHNAPWRVRPRNRSLRVPVPDWRPMSRTSVRRRPLP